MRISIFGIGYVGAVSAACLAQAGHDVIAIDIDPEKRRAIAAGRSPIYETGLNALIAQMVAQGRLRTADNAVDAIGNSDLSLICVGTPSQPDGAVDLSHVRAVCEDIGHALKAHNKYHTVVLRSTMPPGTAQMVCLPIIEETSSKSAGTDFGFAFNPEFLREGTAIADYHNPACIVIGAWDERSAKAVMDLYEGIEGKRTVTTLRIAESVKYAANLWHATKIGFANELGNVLKEAGVDSHRVMDIFCMDDVLNISSAYLKPGFAFGGSCLPKDLHAFRAFAHEKNIATPLFDALSEANAHQVRRAVNMIENTGRKNITILGLAFKPGTDDLRASPLVTLAGELITRGHDVKIFDPAVDQKNAGMLTPHIVAHEDDIYKDTELFVLGHNTDQFKSILTSPAAAHIPVVDLVRAGSRVEERRFYDGICW